MAVHYKKHGDRRRAESRAYHAAHREERNAVAISYYHSNKKAKKNSS
jgi:hypothetical protein